MGDPLDYWTNIAAEFDNWIEEKSVIQISVYHSLTVQMECPHISSVHRTGLTNLNPFIKCSRTRWLSTPGYGVAPKLNTSQQVTP